MPEPATTKTWSAGAGRAAGDGDRVVGQLLDAGDLQGVELRPAPGARGHGSDLLDVLEGLAAAAAAAQGLAGRRAELAQLLGVGRAAQRAGRGAAGGAQLQRHRARATHGSPPRRGDAGRAELAAALVGD